MVTGAAKRKRLHLLFLDLVFISPTQRGRDTGDLIDIRRRGCKAGHGYDDRGVDRRAHGDSCSKGGPTCVRSSSSPSALSPCYLGGPSLVGAQAASPVAPAVAAGGDFAGLVDIGGRSLYLECRGSGSPTVILEAGFRSRADYWTDDLIQPGAPRTMVFPGVAAFTRVCAYDRPGTIDRDRRRLQPSRSDPVAMPRTALDSVHGPARAAPGGAGARTVRPRRTLLRRDASAGCTPAPTRTRSWAWSWSTPSPKGWQDQMTTEQWSCLRRALPASARRACRL